VIGCSAQLTQIQTASNLIHAIYGLNAYAEYGFYNYDACKPNGTVAPIEGIYFMSANLILERPTHLPAQTTRVGFYFREKLNPSRRFCQAAEDVYGEKQTLTMACFARIELHTELEIILENALELKILAWSSVSLQYIGTSGTVPSLVVPLKEIMTSRNQRWSFREEGGHVNSLVGMDY